MNHDELVLGSDAWLAKLLSKNLRTGTMMLLVYGIIASLLVATLVHAIAPGH